MNRDLQDHKVLAESMEWDDLVEIIMDLEREIHELKEIMTKRELNKYNKTLKIYEQAKEKLIEEIKESILNSSVPVFRDYVSYWNDEDEDY